MSGGILGVRKKGRILKRRSFWCWCFLVYFCFEGFKVLRVFESCKVFFKFIGYSNYCD